MAKARNIATGDDAETPDLSGGIDRPDPTDPRTPPNLKADTTSAEFGEAIIDALQTGLRAAHEASGGSAFAEFTRKAGAILARLGREYNHYDEPTPLEPEVRRALETPPPEGPGPAPGDVASYGKHAPVPTPADYARIGRGGPGSVLPGADPELKYEERPVPTLEGQSHPGRIQPDEWTTQAGLAAEKGGSVGGARVQEDTTSPVRPGP